MIAEAPGAPAGFLPPAGFIVPLVLTILLVLAGAALAGWLLWRRLR